MRSVGRLKTKLLRGNVIFTENVEKGLHHRVASPAVGLFLTVPLSFPQPVVQRVESGARVHRPGDPGDARRAGEPAECRGT